MNCLHAAALSVGFVVQMSVTAAIADQLPPRRVVIEDCSVFDSATGKMAEHQTITIRGDRIESVTAALTADSNDSPADATDSPDSDVSSDAEISDDAATTRLDGRGRFIIPGLIDAHVHIVHVLDFAQVTGVEVLPLYMAAGVTSVRSTGDEPVAATLVAQYAAAHPESSPRVFTCSPLLDADPPIHRDVGRAVMDPAAVPELFDELERWHVTTIKIYAKTGPVVGRSIIEEGHRRGLFVTGHLGAYSAQQAVNDGIDGLEHIWSVFNFVIPKEVTGQPGHRGRLDLSNPLCEDLVKQLVKQKTKVDPTLSVFRNMILLSDLPEIKDHPDNLLVPKRLRDFWPVYLKRANCPQGGVEADRRREFAKFQELTGKLYRAGVPLLAGTDAPEPQVTPGFSLHTELELLVESGLPPEAALQAATRNNAAVLGMGNELGAVAAGHLADLVVLQADPLKEIRNTRSIELVIRSGEVCRPNALLQLVPAE